MWYTARWNLLLQESPARVEIMNRRTIAWLLCGLTVPWAGCGQGYQIAPPSPQPPKSTAPVAASGQPQMPGTTTLPASGPNPGSAPVSGPAAARAAMPPAPAAVPIAGPPIAASQQPLVQLRVGTALPQTLPEGTKMGFSVDYEFIGPGPASPSQNAYVWVIERGRGQPAKLKVALQANGNLMTPDFLPWRPEDGPFQSHIEDSSGRMISQRIQHPVTGQ